MNGRICVGYAGFDPLGFSDYYDINWLKEAEIKHGRICMLAAVGMVIASCFVSPSHSLPCFLQRYLCCRYWATTFLSIHPSMPVASGMAGWLGSSLPVCRLHARLPSRVVRPRLAGLCLGDLDAVH